LTLCDSSSGAAAPTLPILVPKCSEKNRPSMLDHFHPLIADQKLSKLWSTTFSFFHVKNRAAWLCVIPVPVPLHRSFRF
jgi:hypothetical protein